MMHFWKLVVAALILSLVLAGLNVGVMVLFTNQTLTVAVAATVVSTFLALCAAHWLFGARYVSCQPDLVHRQYNLLWANGV